MATDGSVEIRITGSVDPSVAASANAAKASLGGLGDATAGVTNKANISAAAMKTLVAATGSWEKATKALAAANGDVAAALAASTAAEEVNTAATAANTGVVINNRAAYESLVIVHEALQGRFTRMAGSSMILGQALAGQEAVTKLVTFATSLEGAAILGTVGVMATAAIAAAKYEESQKQLLATTIGLGAQSGLTADQLDEAAHAAANYASQSISETTKAAESFAAAGVKSEKAIQELSGSVETYAQLTGVKFADAQKTLAEAMQDPIRGSEELHRQLGILDGDQMNQIRRLVELGDKDQAVTILLQAYIQRINEANQAGVGAVGMLGELKNSFSNLWGWIGKTSSALIDFRGILFDLTGIWTQSSAASNTVTDAIRRHVQAQTALNVASAKGAAAFDGTPEGEAIARKSQLIGKVNELRQAMEADTKLHGANSDAVKRDKQALDDYTHAVNTYLTPVQQKLKADELDVKIAQAKHAHNKQLVADLTEQKALIQESGKIESEADARALAKGRGDVAGARTFAPKTKGPKGPSIVSEWQEQLHAAEIASNDFFADQTEKELQFWQGKVGQVKKGSKDWLEVQTKIYEAQKTLAHKDYEEHIADLNDRLEADHEDFAKFQKDWQEKLDFIRSKFKEESTEYKNAHRQMVSEERAFQDRLIHEELTGQNKQIAALKQNLAAQKSLREEYAKIAETVLTNKGQSNPFAEIASIKQIAQIHHQLALAEIQDAQTAYNKENELRTKGVADALVAYGKDDQRYKSALADKLNADKQYYLQKKQLEAKDLQQQLQDIQRLKAAYHQYIDGTVQATVSGFANMADGTGTWRDAVIGIYNSIKSAAEQVISQIIENWIVNLLIGKSAQATTAESQVLSYAGVAGAAGVASWAAAPWPIDAGAPGFGASMASAAAAFAPMAALAQGTNELPRDMIVQAHEGERVMPKADNRKLFEVLSQATGGGQGGGIHLHSSPVFNGNQTSMWQHMVDNHEREMMRWMKRQFINGPLRPSAN